MAAENKGRITQVIGAVLDIQFPAGTLPEINEAIRIEREEGGVLIVEVSQHLGDDTVRCIAMGSTDGCAGEWMRLQQARRSAYLSVRIRWAACLTYWASPSTKNLCRKGSATSRSTARHPNLKISPRGRRCLRRALRSWICSALIRRAEKPACSAARA